MNDDVFVPDSRRYYRIENIGEGNHSFHVPVCFPKHFYIGKGGYGAVISIENDDERYALKKLSFETEPDSTSNLFNPKVQFALRELHFMRSINHVNIIKSEYIYGVENKPTDFRVYVIMELMEWDLHQLNLLVHQQYDKFEHEDLSHIIYQLCCGLRHLKKLNIIHRDLKPSNIGVKRIVRNVDGQEEKTFIVKLLDFGMARIPREGEDPRMTERVVTLRYRAPEVFVTRGNYAHPMDVWSLGCIFAELLDNAPLFPLKDDPERALPPKRAIEEMAAIIGNPEQAYLDHLQQQNIHPKLPGIKQFDVIFPAERFSATEFAEHGLTATSARDLLRKMLWFHEDNRITVEAALDHPYLKYWPEEDEESTEVQQIPLISGLNVNDDSCARKPNEALADVKTLVLDEMGKHPELFATA